MRRIDLRGAAAAAVDLGSAVPRAAFDVEAAVQVVRPICDDVRARGVDAIVEYSARFDGVEQTDIAVPTAALSEALAQLDPAVRAGLEESIRRLRRTVRGRARAGRRHRPRRRRPGDPPQGAGPARRALRAGRHRAARLLGDHERGARAGRGGAARSRSRPRRRRTTAGSRTRRSWPPARCSASTRCTPSAAPRRSRCSRTARARAARSTWSPGRASIYTVAAKRLLKGVVGIDSEAGPDGDRDPGRRHRRRGLRGRRPDLARPSTTRPRHRSWSPRPSGSPPTSRPSWTSRSRSPGTPSGSAPR